jgi:hypothetical protein
MAYEQHFEGDDSGRTWRSPSNDIYIPPAPVRRPPPVVIRITIKTPGEKKSEQPPITFEGGDFDGGTPARPWMPVSSFPEHDGLRERQNRGSARIQERLDRQREREERRDN